MNVPDLHVPLGMEEGQLLLGDLRPDRRDVPVVEHVQDVPADQGGLPDGLFADEAHLHFELFLGCHQEVQPGGGRGIRTEPPVDT